jgi:hypothetical protein
MSASKGMVLVPEIMTPGEAAAYLRLEPDTLRFQRSVGTGPPFYKLGKGRNAPVRYLASELIGWMKQNSSGGARR